MPFAMLAVMLGLLGATIGRLASITTTAPSAADADRRVSRGAGAGVLAAILLRGLHLPGWSWWGELVVLAAFLLATPVRLQATRDWWTHTVVPRLMITARVARSVLGIIAHTILEWVRRRLADLRGVWSTVRRRMVANRRVTALIIAGCGIIVVSTLWPAIGYHAIGAVLGAWFSYAIAAIVTRRRPDRMSPSPVRVAGWGTSLGLVVASFTWHAGLTVPRAWLAVAGMAAGLAAILLLTRRFGGRETAAVVMPRMLATWTDAVDIARYTGFGASVASIGIWQVWATVPAAIVAVTTGATMLGSQLRPGATRTRRVGSAEAQPASAPRIRGTTLAYIAAALLGAAVAWAVLGDSWWLPAILAAASFWSAVLINGWWNSPDPAAAPPLPPLLAKALVGLWLATAFLAACAAGLATGPWVGPHRLIAVAVSLSLAVCAASAARYQHRHQPRARTVRRTTPRRG